MGLVSMLPMSVGVLVTISDVKSSQARIEAAVMIVFLRSQVMTCVYVFRRRFQAADGGSQQDRRSTKYISPGPWVWLAGRLTVLLHTNTQIV